MKMARNGKAVLRIDGKLHSEGQSEWCYVSISIKVRRKLGRNRIFHLIRPPSKKHIVRVWFYTLKEMEILERSRWRSRPRDPRDIIEGWSRSSIGKKGKKRITEWGFLKCGFTRTNRAAASKRRSGLTGWGESDRNIRNSSPRGHFFYLRFSFAKILG